MCLGTVSKQLHPQDLQEGQLPASGQLHITTARTTVGTTGGMGLLLEAVLNPQEADLFFTAVKHFKASQLRENKMEEKVFIMN